MNEFIFYLGNLAVYILILLWLYSILSWKEKRNAFLQRSIFLISKPIIFEKDPKPENLLLFPRRLLESIAAGFQNSLKFPFRGIINNLNRLLNNLWEQVYNPKRPSRIAGYIFFLIMLVVFIYADAIAIVNGLDAFGLLESGVPAYLTQYSIAVAMGSLFSVITGALVAKDLFSSTSQFSDWEEKEGGWKKFAKVLSVALMLGGFIVVINLGLLRLGAFADLQAAVGNRVTTLSDIILTVLVPLNTVLATALIFEEGLLKGGILLLLLLGSIVSAVLSAIDYFLSGLAYIIPFLLDLILRVIYFLGDLILYLIVTPIDWIGELRTASRPLRFLVGVGLLVLLALVLGNYLRPLRLLALPRSSSRLLGAPRRLPLPLPQLRQPPCSCLSRVEVIVGSQVGQPNSSIGSSHFGPRSGNGSCRCLGDKILFVTSWKSPSPIKSLHLQALFIQPLPRFTILTIVQGFFQKYGFLRFLQY